MKGMALGTLPQFNRAVDRMFEGIAPEDLD